MASKGSTGRAGAFSAALVALLVLAGCGRGVSFHSGAHHAAGAISPADAHRLLAADTTVLVLDVRDLAEWSDELGHLPRARLVPLPELPQRLDELSGWKEHAILVVDRDGARSHRAAEWLESRGFQDVRPLAGGLRAWRAAGY